MDRLGLPTLLQEVLKTIQKCDKYEELTLFSNHLLSSKLGILYSRFHHLDRMPFYNFMDASHSVRLPSMTSETRTCAECGKIIINMHSKTMNSVITHRGIYRAQGLCETCDIKNDIERLLLKLRTLSKVERRGKK